MNGLHISKFKTKYQILRILPEILEMRKFSSLKVIYEDLKEKELIFCTWNTFKANFYALNKEHVASLQVSQKQQKPRRSLPL